MGCLACVRLLLEAADAPGDVNAVTRACRSVLHVAVERGDVDMVDYLLKHRHIQIDLKENKGNFKRN